MVTGSVFLAEYGDVVIRAVHRRTHEIRCAGVQTDIFLVDMLFVNRCSNKRAERCEHISAELGVDFNVVHTRWYEDFLIFLSNAVTDDCDIVLRFLGLVVNSYAAGEVYELDMYACLFLQTYGKFKENAL